MKTISLFFAIITILACQSYAIFVETLDEQINSKVLTTLRIRLNNESDRILHNVTVKYFIQKKTK